MDYTFGKLMAALKQGGKDMENIGVRLAKLLQAKRMTQKELAETVGVTEATISRYMSGDRIPRGSILSNIATVLDTTSDYLLGNEPEGDLENDFPKIQRLIARNSAKMTEKQKKELLEALFTAE